MRHSTIIMLLIALVPAPSPAAEIYLDFPKEIRSNERYVIFSHGMIAEGTDPRPIHPTRGLYDLPAIREALFKGGAFNLVSHQRPKDTPIKPYVDTLESWVKQLLAAGVPASRITLVGFSRGAHLTAYASGRLVETGINTALMGACSDGDIVRDPPLAIGGHFLSIYDTTDTVLSCEKIAARSNLKSFKEIAIDTGKGHAAFFLPRPEWIGPLREWIDATNR